MERRPLVIDEIGVLRELPAGDSLPVNTYTHQQLTPSAEWWIIHHLNRYPSVTVIDSGQNVVYGDVVYLSDHEIKLIFSAGFSGFAYLN